MWHKDRNWWWHIQQVQVLGYTDDLDLIAKMGETRAPKGLLYGKLEPVQTQVKARMGWRSWARHIKFKHYKFERKIKNKRNWKNTLDSPATHTGPRLTSGCSALDNFGYVPQKSKLIKNISTQHGKKNCLCEIVIRYFIMDV